MTVDSLQQRLYRATVWSAHAPAHRLDEAQAAYDAALDALVADAFERGRQSVVEAVEALYRQHFDANPQFIEGIAAAVRAARSATGEPT